MSPLLGPLGKETCRTQHSLVSTITMSDHATRSMLPWFVVEPDEECSGSCEERERRGACGVMITAKDNKRAPTAGSIISPRILPKSSSAIMPSHTSSPFVIRRFPIFPFPTHRHLVHPIQHAQVHINTRPIDPHRSFLVPF